MKKRFAAFLLAVSSALFAWADGGSGALSDSEIWNEGVTLYRDGNMTNALEKLRPLMLSRTHGPRAAEVVAAIHYDRAHSGDAKDPAKELSEAAAAAQIALRANPKDERAARNFTRATDGLPELLRTRKINEILETAKGKDPSQMLRAESTSRAF